jgi:hypothetical protein
MTRTKQPPRGAFDYLLEPIKAWTQHSWHQTQSSSQIRGIAWLQRLLGVLISPQPAGLCLADMAPDGLVV